MDGVEEGGELIDLVQLAGQGRRKVESKAIDVHLLHPVAQAVHDQLQHLGVAHVQGVAGAGEVHVVARIVLNQPVVGGVVEALERQRRPQLVAFRRMVVDHVQNDLDAVLVQRFHHRLELADLLATVAAARVLGLGCEEVNRVVAPVVVEALAHQVLAIDVRMYRQKLHRGNAEVLQVVQRRLAGETGISAL